MLQKESIIHLQPLERDIQGERGFPRQDIRCRRAEAVIRDMSVQAYDRPVGASNLGRTTREDFPDPLGASTTSRAIAHEIPLGLLAGPSRMQDR